MSNRKTLRLRKGRAATLAGVLLLLILSGAWLTWTWLNPIRLKETRLVLQVGTDYDPASNIASVFRGAPEQVAIEPALDTSRLGETEITYTFKGRSRTIPVQIADLKAPRLTVKDLVTDLDTEVEAESFVEAVIDDTRTSLRILNPEDVLFHEGTRTIRIQAMDEYGNSSTALARLTRKEDPEAPSLDSLPDTLDWQVDQEWQAPSIQAVDEADGLLDVEVDDSALNIHAAGDYIIRYSATDSSGNTAQKDVTVRVREKDPVASTGQ